MGELISHLTEGKKNRTLVLPFKVGKFIKLL